MSSPNCIPGFDRLAALDRFSPDVLRAGDKAEQEVCDFVLALALASNDLKDIIWAYANLKPHEPSKPELTPGFGQYAGMTSHLDRLLYSLFHELFKLIHENPNPRNHPEFMKTVSSLSRENLKRWNSLVSISNGSTKSDEFLYALIRIRDDIASHYYGLKALSRGYQTHFSKPGIGRDFGYISRGSSMESTRFYFADAAASGAFDNVLSVQLKGKISDHLSEIARIVNTAVFDVVTKFIERRSGGWDRAHQSL